MSVAFGAG